VALQSLLLKIERESTNAKRRVLQKSKGQL
jgi:hypothetical protein